MSRGADNTRRNICIYRIYRYKKNEIESICAHWKKNALSFFLNASVLEQDCNVTTVYLQAVFDPAENVLQHFRKYFCVKHFQNIFRGGYM